MLMLPNTTDLVHFYYILFLDSDHMFAHVAAHSMKIPVVNKSKIITGTKHIMSEKPTNQEQNK